MKKAVYFVSWIVLDQSTIRVGNSAVYIPKRITGEAFIRYVVQEITAKQPRAIVISICKVG